MENQPLGMNTEKKKMGKNKNGQHFITFEASQDRKKLASEMRPQKVLWLQHRQPTTELAPHFFCLNWGFFRWATRFSPQTVTPNGFGNGISSLRNNRKTIWPPTETRIRILPVQTEITYGFAGLGTQIIPPPPPPPPPVFFWA